MSIIFSDHAKAQLKRRYISQARVIKAIDNPNKITTSYRNRRLRQRFENDKILEVVTITEGSKITVVTAYYLEEKR